MKRGLRRAFARRRGRRRVGRKTLNQTDALINKTQPAPLGTVFSRAYTPAHLTIGVVSAPARRASETASARRLQPQ